MKSHRRRTVCRVQPAMRGVRVRNFMTNVDHVPVKRPVWRGDITSLAGKAYKAIEE